MLKAFKQCRERKKILKAGDILSQYILYAKHVQGKKIDIIDATSKLYDKAFGLVRAKGYRPSYACHLVGKEFIADGG